MIKSSVKPDQRGVSPSISPGIEAIQQWKVMEQKFINNFIERFTLGQPYLLGGSSPRSSIGSCAVFLSCRGGQLCTSWLLNRDMVMTVRGSSQYRGHDSSRSTAAGCASPFQKDARTYVTEIDRVAIYVCSRDIIISNLLSREKRRLHNDRITVAE